MEVGDVALETGDLGFQFSQARVLGCRFAAAAQQRGGYRDAEEGFHVITMAGSDGSKKGQSALRIKTGHYPFLLTSSAGTGTAIVGGEDGYALMKLTFFQLYHALTRVPGSSAAPSLKACHRFRFPNKLNPVTVQVIHETDR